MNVWSLLPEWSAIIVIIVPVMILICEFNIVTSIVADDYMCVILVTVVIVTGYAIINYNVS